jgi:nitrogen fixation NifU-like protein
MRGLVHLRNCGSRFAATGTRKSVDKAAITAMEQDDFYQERILDHYESPYHRGHCRQPTHMHRGKNPLCGDVVQIEMVLGRDGRIEEIFFSGEGCCISQASASMLLESLDGKTVDDVKQFTAQQMLELFGTRLTPNRQKCCLLPWRVLQSAVHSPVGAPDGEGNGQADRAKR